MLIKTIPVGQLETNCYVVTEEASLVCAVIDPGDESSAILDYLESNKLKCTHIFITHGHFDHTMAVRAVQEATGAQVYMHEKDTNPTLEDASLRYSPPDGTIFYEEGDQIQVGDMVFYVMETPGHSEGSVCLVCEKEKVIFSGDTLFKGSCGRTDFPGSDPAKMMASLGRLYHMPGNFEVYPGHMDATTLDVERVNNPYLSMAGKN